MIADTGIGMSADYLPHLFEPYSREMRFGERQAVGTGLGMPITQSIVTQMNGEIHVESAPGEGHDLYHHTALCHRPQSTAAGRMIRRTAGKRASP